jgi:hypothetical protein
MNAKKIKIRLTSKSEPHIEYSRSMNKKLLPKNLPPVPIRDTRKKNKVSASKNVAKRPGSQKMWQMVETTR